MCARRARRRRALPARLTAVPSLRGRALARLPSQTGEICLDILKEDAWTPAWTIQSVCRAVIALLSSPEANSPLNCDAGNLIRNGDARGFVSMARMYTQLHASAPAQPSASASEPSCARP